MDFTAQQSIGLHSMPAEILLCIFDWVCHNEIDLSLLIVSHKIRSVLLCHPVVQTLGAFQIEWHRNIVRVVPIKEISNSLVQSMSAKLLCTAKSSSLEDISKKPWCTDKLMLQVQRAMTRSLIKAYWTPYLQRDGRLRTPQILEDKLEQVTTAYLMAEEMPGGMRTVFDTTKEYSWTRIEIWPLDGRVIIRDQVLNTTKELHIPIIGQYQLAKLSSRSCDDARV